MPYDLEQPAPGMPGQGVLRTGVNSWRHLVPGGPGRHVAVKMGASVVLLPVYSHHIGDDDTDFENALLGETTPSGNSGFGPILGSSDPDNPFGSAGADDQYTTPAGDLALSDLSLASGANLPYNLPSVATGGVNVPGSVAANAVAQAGPSAATPGTPAYNALLAAGLTAAQIAAAVKTPTVAAPTSGLSLAGLSAATGLSSTALLFGGAILLIVVAGGKKR